MTIVDCGAPWVTLVDESCSKKHREWSLPGGGGGGGALVTTHGQTAVRSGGGERQNLGVVNRFEGKKGGRSTSY